MQKTQEIDFFIPEILMIKESCDLIGWEQILVNNFKKYVINEENTGSFPLNSITAKNLRHWFLFPKVLMIKEFCDLIGREYVLDNIWKFWVLDCGKKHICLQKN